MLQPLFSGQTRMPGVDALAGMGAFAVSITY